MPVNRTFIFSGSTKVLTNGTHKKYQYMRVIHSIMRIIAQDMPVIAANMRVIGGEMPELGSNMRMIARELLVTRCNMRMIGGEMPVLGANMRMIAGEMPVIGCNMRTMTGNTRMFQADPIQIAARSSNVCSIPRTTERVWYARARKQKQPVERICPWYWV